MGLNTTRAVHIPQETYRRVATRARKMGKAPDEWTREVVEAALRSGEQARPKTTVEVLQAAGRIRPLSEALRRKIIPGVTLDEVRSCAVGNPRPFAERDHRRTARVDAVSDYYLDASALVKRYVDEIGSAWVRQLTEPARATPYSWPKSPWPKWRLPLPSSTGCPAE